MLKKMKCVLFFIGVLISFMAVNVTAQSSIDTVPAEARLAAERDMKQFLNDFPRESLEKYKYVLSGDDINTAMLGEGYAEYTIDFDKFNKATDSDEMSTFLKPIGWSFPVYLNGELRTLITVGTRDGEWKKIQFGGDPKPIIETRNKWTEDKGYSQSYLKIVGIADFIIIKKDDKTYLYSFREREEEKFGVSKLDDGFYPLMDSKKVLNIVKSYISDVNINKFND